METKIKIYNKEYDLFYDESITNKGYWGYLTNYSGVASQGKTLEDLKYNLVDAYDAIKSYETNLCVDKVLKEYETKVFEYKKGATGLLGFFMAHVLKKLNYECDLKFVLRILEKKLEL